MAPTLPTPPPNRTTKAFRGGSLRIPAAIVLEIVCPKCGAQNLAQSHHYVWRVVDERGAHYECDCCAESWTS